MSELRLRRANFKDAEALALVGGATFLETYALSLGGTDIVRHCAKAHAVAVYASWLADADCAIWVVEAGEGSTIVGYAVLTASDLPNALKDDLELRRIYVLTRFQGRGMGSALVEAAAGEARGRGATRLTLGMYGENHAALAFYRRMGFDQIGTRHFQVGDRVCFDYVLGLRLLETESTTQT